MSTLRVNSLKPRSGSTITIVENNTLAVTGIASIGGNLDVTGQVNFGQGATVTGVVTFADANLESALTLTSLNVGSNIRIGNAGVITATSFHGDGSNLTGIDATQIANGTSSVAVAENANITVTHSGSSKLVVNGAGIDVTGIATCDGLRSDGAVTQTERTITSGSFDLSTGNFWTCGAINIPNPTGITSVMSGLIRLTAEPLSWGGNFSTAPTANSYPAIVPFYVESASSIRLGTAVEVS